MAPHVPPPPALPRPSALPSPPAPSGPPPPFTAPETIRTERLVLRRFAEADVDDVLAYQSDPEVVRYLMWEVRNRDEVAEALKPKIAAKLSGSGDAMTYAIALPGGPVIGETLLKWIDAEQRQGEIGWVLNPRYQGRGYATEAAREMLRFGFETVGLHRITAGCDGRNGASAAVMRRLGMRQEAHFIQNEVFKGEWTDLLVYAMLAAEWRGGPQAG